MNKLWIVGLSEVCSNCEEGWRLDGVYDTEEKAVAACLNDDYFVGPVSLNVPQTGSWWKGCYYPTSETQKEAEIRFAS